MTTLAVNRHRGKIKYSGNNLPKRHKKQVRSGNRLGRLPLACDNILIVLSRTAAKCSTTRPFSIDYRKSNRAPPLPSPARLQRTGFLRANEQSLEAPKAKNKGKDKAQASLSCGWPLSAPRACCHAAPNRRHNPTPTPIYHLQIITGPWREPILQKRHHAYHVVSPILLEASKR